MNVWTVILAAGSGTRLASCGITERKQFLSWNGLPLFWHSVLAFSPIPAMQGIVLVVPGDALERCRKLVSDLDSQRGVGLPVVVTPGGTRRQDSVCCGLSVLPRECDTVLIHDAARPFVSGPLIQRVLDALTQGALGAIPVVPVTDTVKEIRDGRVHRTLDRSVLAAVQTPQGFVRSALAAAHAKAGDEGWEGTDDASLLERCDCEVRTVNGSERNVKITTPDDLNRLDSTTSPQTRVGWGYDVHRFGPGRPLVLGGVPVPGPLEVVAHSDGDVLLHALCDAILGCAGLGDIGQHFPDTDPAFDGLESGILLSEVLDKTTRAGLRITHADLTVIAQIPKLSPFRDQIRRNVASLLGLELDQVNVKATTEEGLGFTGEKKGIKAVAVVVGTKEPACRG
ncbi:MAG: 2-C-methyl-D-erythritol 4-phosphate cytidylyltransferase [Desulfovibrionales bacterium]